MVTAGNPPSHIAAPVSASSAASRIRRFWITHSSAQNNAGMNAATRLCGQFTQTIMNALVANARPPSSAAGLPNRSRRRNR